MNLKIKSMRAALAAVLSGLSFVAGATTGDRQSNPATIGVSASSQTKNFVREWDPYGFRKKTGSYPSGGWYIDGEETEADSSKQIGGLWLCAKLAKGKAYLITSSRDVQITAKGDSTFTKFKEIVIKGVKYKYIRADEWESPDASQVEYYIYAFGGLGSVGSSFTITFSQRSIDDILAQTDGTYKKPYPLNVLADGSRTIEDSPCREPAGRLTTAYSANLKANVKYVFKGVAPVPGVGVLVTTLPEDRTALKGKGTWTIDESKGMMTIMLTVDYKITLLVMPDEANWETGNVSGGTLSWKVGSDPVKGGVYSGTLCGVYGQSRVSGQFRVVSKVMEDGERRFSATLKVGDESYVYVDDGDGWIFGMTKADDGKLYESYFLVEVMDQQVVRISGSAILGHWQEYEFEGDLNGDMLDWKDSLLPFDPKTDSAAEMGIDSGALKNLAAGNEELVRVYDWATLNNVGVSAVKTIDYSSSGDPIGLAATAYLLDCPANDSAVEIAKGEFVITAFDPLTGEVTLGDGRHDGDSFGNGLIEVRTATEIGGPFESKDRDGLLQLFYKAFLVRGQH